MWGHHSPKTGILSVLPAILTTPPDSNTHFLHSNTHITAYFFWQYTQVYLHILQRKQTLALKLTLLFIIRYKNVQYVQQLTPSPSRGGGYTLTGQKTSLHHPRSEQHSETCSNKRDRERKCESSRGLWMYHVALWCCHGEGMFVFISTFVSSF